MCSSLSSPRCLAGALSLLCKDVHCARPQLIEEQSKLRVIGVNLHSQALPLSCSGLVQSLWMEVLPMLKLNIEHAWPMQQHSAHKLSTVQCQRLTCSYSPLSQAVLWRLLTAALSSGRAWRTHSVNEIMGAVLPDVKHGPRELVASAE